MAARTITHNGVTLTITEWAKRTDQMPRTLRWRLNAGWPIEQALHLPLDPRGRERTDRQEQTMRLDRELRTKAVQINREFGKLVFAVDSALRSFREKLNSLLPDEQTPGVVKQPAESPPNRTIPSAQDSRNLEIS